MRDPDPASASNEEERIILQILADVQEARGMRYWHQFAEIVRGVSEETTTGSSSTLPAHGILIHSCSQRSM